MVQLAQHLGVSRDEGGGPPRHGGENLVGRAHDALGRDDAVTGRREDGAVGCGECAVVGRDETAVGWGEDAAGAHSARGRCAATGSRRSVTR